MKLLIGIPSNRDWNPEFCMSLISLALHFTRSKASVAIRPLTGISCLPDGRQRILNEAIKENFTHLLFIDDDMQFKPEAVDLLISRDKDFVCANCIRRNTDPMISNTHGKDGKCIYSAGKDGIERITYTGLAFALIKIDAIKNIPPPHFEIKWFNDFNDYLSEDKGFCFLLAQHDTELWVDHDASRHVWHMGQNAQQENFS